MKKRIRITYLRSVRQTAIYYSEIIDGKLTGIYSVEFHRNV